MGEGQAFPPAKRAQTPSNSTPESCTPKSGSIPPESLDPELIESQLDYYETYGCPNVPSTQLPASSPSEISAADGTQKPTNVVSRRKRSRGDSSDKENSPSPEKRQRRTGAYPASPSSGLDDTLSLMLLRESSRRATFEDKIVALITQISEDAAAVRKEIERETRRSL